jgi:hypothetical protein
VSAYTRALLRLRRWGKIDHLKRKPRQPYGVSWSRVKPGR